MESIFSGPLAESAAATAPPVDAVKPIVPVLTFLQPSDDAAVCGPDGMCL